MRNQGNDLGHGKNVLDLVSTRMGNPQPSPVISINLPQLLTDVSAWTIEYGCSSQTKCQWVEYIDSA